MPSVAQKVSHYFFQISTLSVVLMLLSSCAEVIEPMPTRLLPTITSTNVAISEPTVVVTQMATPSPTPSTVPSVTPTRTPQPTLTQRPTDTPAPSSTPTNTLTPTITPTSLPHIMWSNDIQDVTLVESGNVVWSPAANEIVLDYCSSLISTDLYPSTILRIGVAHAPLFQIIDTQTDGVYCSYYPQLFWRPDGGKVAFNAVPEGILPGQVTYGDGAMIFTMGQNGNSFENTQYSLTPNDFYGWMDNEKIVTSNYSGGGHAVALINNIDKRELLAWGWSYGLSVPHITPNYAVIEQNIAGNSIILGLFSTLQLKSIDEEKGRYQAPYANFLATEDDFGVLEFGAKYLDTFHQSEQLLVLTWADDQVLFDEATDLFRDSGIFDIQIWDLAIDRLKIEVPNGLYGRISPDDGYLVYVQPNLDSPLLKLKDIATQDIVFSQPVYVEFNGPPPLAEAFTTFSPDGRFLTYFDIDQQLVVFDVIQQRIFTTLDAKFEAPVWSPDNTKMTFIDENDQVAVFDVSLFQQRPLAIGADLSRLSNPQWSFDGSYLSVTVDYGGQNWGTAILSFVEN